MAAVVLLVITVLSMIVVAFMVGRYLTKRQHHGEQLSLVTRQHINLYQGGQLNDDLVEAAKVRFRGLLERGEIDAVEAALRPGIQYVVKVRALTEIGTDDAGRILERQLQRRLSDDELEQSWYWIDLAHGLRHLNRQDSLPHLLRCAHEAAQVPLGHFFAAETVCFLGFSGYLQEVESPLGNAALRLLHRALEGLRQGVQPQMVSEARLGEAIERLWDNRPDTIHPLLVRVLIESLRLLRREPQAIAILAQESYERESFELQVSRLAALEPVLTEYLDDAPPSLLKQLANANSENAEDILHALIDLRAETAVVVLPLLKNKHFEQAELAIESLTWSRDLNAGAWLRETAWRHFGSRSHIGRLKLSKRFSCPPGVVASLRALRGHPGADTERTLAAAAGSADVDACAAACSSLGWWEPEMREPVLACLKQASRDDNSIIRPMARAALARLGERRSLHWFRQALASEDTIRVHEAVHFISVENLTLLWPDLDRLADSENPEIAQHAREALHQLFEQMEWDRRGLKDS